MPRRPLDLITAAGAHATARFTVRYGDGLDTVGRDLPAQKRKIAGVRVFAYGEPGAPVCVHLHGGAWMMRHPVMDEWWCRYLAATAGVQVLNVDFRTGPYVTYPVSQEQAHAVAAEAGAAVVSGFSSGGGMAAAVCLMARDRGSFVPRLQVLGVPALDMASEIPPGAGMISSDLRAQVRRVYFPDVARRSEPYASPLLADDLTGLPAAVVLTAERDSLRPDGDRYAERLRAAGVEVLHDVMPGADHYFLTKDNPRAPHVMQLVADEVRRRVS